MSETKIEWADRTINPVTGCTPISPGCNNCYAKRMAKRLAGRYGYPNGDGFNVTLHPGRLADIEALAKVKKPQRVFVGSMTDLFHPEVPFDFLRRLWADMSNPFVNHHTFMILTKRPGRMLEFFDWMEMQEFKVETYLPNIWVGVTAENQEQADKRIPLLLQTPVTVRFVSVEPMLGPVDLTNIYYENVTAIDALNGLHGFPKPHAEGPKLDWVICGGETGPGARPMHPDWARSLRDQCQAAVVPYFFKQWGEWEAFYDRDNDDPDWCNIPKDGPGVKRLNLAGGSGFHGERVVYLRRVGKKKAGRVLDGWTWDELPI